MIPPRRRWYRGVHYRSTLEADWSATLRSLGIEHRYEPEAYQTPEGTYGPDFWLPGQHVWLEVKGPHGERIGKAESFANLLAVAHESDGRIDDYGQITYPVSPTHAVLVYGLPARDGCIEMRTPRHFGTRADFGHCPRCDHWTILFDDVGQCRVCLHSGDDLFLKQGIPFRRARDDGGG